MSEEILQKTARLAKDMGAHEFDILMNKSKNFSLKVNNEKIDEYKISTSQSIGIRIIKNNKLGLAFTEDTSADSLKWMIKNALLATDYTDADPDESICLKAQNYLGEVRKLENVATEEKCALAIKLETEVKKRDKRVVTTPYNNYTDYESQKFILNSNGKYSTESNASYSVFTSAFMKEGNDSALFYYPTVAKNFKDLNINTCIDYCIEHASNQLKAKPIASGKYDVIFSTEVLQELWDFYYGVFSGRKAKEKMNPWGNQLGQLVASEKLNLVDDPFNKSALFHSYIDDEGVLRQPLKLIKNGRLENFMHNSNSASYFKTESTGHGTRTTSSPLGVSGTYFSFAAGPDQDSEIFQGKVLKIIDAQGLHSGANAISGDFSFGVKGYIYEDGQKKTSFKGVTVAGNFFEMLKAPILVGQKIEADPTHRFFAPLMRFRQLSIAGV